MDFIKKAVDGAKGSGENKPQEGQADGQTAGQASGQAQGGDQQDYVDKAFGFASKKSGYNVDRNTEEKITDGGRTAYEKLTGSKVDPKISN